MVLQVVTSKLNAFVDDTSLVFVESGGVYIQKPASQLEVGEHVVVERQSIDTSLERIDAILRSQQPTYQTAHSVVFDRDVPRLRAELWRAILPPSTGLDAIIQGTSGADFTDDEYSEAITKIQETGVTVKRDAIRGWLSGETYAPMEWDNLATLAQGLSSPALQQMHDSRAQASGFFHEYKYYVAARSTLMHHIAEYSHSSSPSVSLSSAAAPRRRFNTEISLVLQQLLADGKIIDETYQTARVMEVKRVKRSAAARPSSSGQSGAGQHLFSGIATETLPYASLTLQEVVETVNILESIVRDTIHSLLDQDIFYPLLHSSKRDGEFPPSIIHLTVDYILAHLIPVPHFQQTCDLVDISNEKYGPVYKAFNLLISNGRLDAQFGMVPGTFSKVLDALRTYFSFVPREYTEIIMTKKQYLLEHPVMSFPLYTDLQRRLKPFGDALTAKGVSPNHGVLLNSYYQGFAALHDEGQVIDYERARREAIKDGYRFFTRQDVEAHLDKIGIPRNAVRLLHPNNFV